VTNRPLIVRKNHSAAVSFLLCCSRCIQSYCGNCNMGTMYIFLSVN